MTQLARPDLARSRPVLHHLRLRPAAAGPPVPGWALVTALLAPAVLVAGWLIAGALQPAAYSPVRETISVLAGYTGADRWVMTTALLLVGGCQIATAAGLTAVRAPARALLVLTGLCMAGIAANPELATGPTLRHLAFAVSCDVTTAVWPLLVARRAPAPSRVLSVRGCVTVTVLFAGLSCWLLAAAQNGDGDLGLVERLTSGVQGLFPFVVALALWRTAHRTLTSDESVYTTQAGRCKDPMSCRNVEAWLHPAGHRLGHPHLIRPRWRRLGPVSKL
jgi:hypothetical membrane protein